MCSQHCVEFRERAIAGNLAEIAFGFWDPGGGPAQDQCAACQGSPPTSCLAHSVYLVAAAYNLLGMARLVPAPV